MSLGNVIRISMEINHEPDVSDLSSGNPEFGPAYCAMKFKLRSMKWVDERDKPFLIGLDFKRRLFEDNGKYYFVLEAYRTFSYN